MEESTLDKIRTRPRFKLTTTLSPEEYMLQIQQYLALHKDEFHGNINTEFATIFVKTTEDNYWKPNLALRTEIEEEETIIRGIFGPSAAVWTFFMFLYFIFGILWMVLFTLFFVEKQIKSNEFPWAFSCSNICLLLLFINYIVARIGQIKAKKEMEKLRKFAIDSTLPFEGKKEVQM